MWKSRAPAWKADGPICVSLRYDSAGIWTRDLPFTFSILIESTCLVETRNTKHDTHILILYMKVCTVKVCYLAHIRTHKTCMKVAKIAYHKDGQYIVARSFWNTPQTLMLPLREQAVSYHSNVRKQCQYVCCIVTLDLCSYVKRKVKLPMKA